MFRFLKAKTVSHVSDVKDIDLGEVTNYLPLEEVFIGHHTATYLTHSQHLIQMVFARFVLLVNGSKRSNETTTYWPPSFKQPELA